MSLVEGVSKSKGPQNGFRENLAPDCKGLTVSKIQHVNWVDAEAEL